MASIPTLQELASWPAVVDVPTAGTALGIGRAAAYALAAAGDFPVRVLRIGQRLKVPTADLIQLLDCNSATADEAP